jgi:hypothetical protein
LLTDHLLFWQTFLAELGVLEELPADLEPDYRTGATLLPQEPSPVQLAIGRLHRLLRCDAVLIPQLSPQLQDQDELNGNPWVVDFAATASVRFSLPHLVSVDPAAAGESLKSLAVSLGLRWSQPVRVRRALERSYPRAQGRAARPDWAGLGRAVGLLGPRYLLEQPWLYHGLLEQLAQLGLRPLPGHLADPARSLELGRRLVPGLREAPELEVAGQRAQLELRSAVRALIWLLPERLPVSRALGDWMAKPRSDKPLLKLPIDQPEAGGDPLLLEDLAARIR